MGGDQSDESELFRDGGVGGDQSAESGLPPVRAARPLAEFLCLGFALLAFEAAALGTLGRFGRSALSFLDQRLFHFVAKAFECDVFVAELGSVVVDVGAHDFAELAQ